MECLWIPIVGDGRFYWYLPTRADSSNIREKSRRVLDTSKYSMGPSARYPRPPTGIAPSRCRPAFRGQTPDEIYFGRGHRIAEHLDEAKKRARAARLQANRASSCGACRQPTPMSDKTLAVTHRLGRLVCQAVLGSHPGQIPRFSQDNRTGPWVRRPPGVRATRTGQIRANGRQSSQPLRVEYSNGKVQNVLRISMVKLLDRELSGDGGATRNGARREEQDA